MIKKFLIGTFAVVALALAVTASAAYDFGTTTLKVGSKGPAVIAVQTVVGATPDGSFGPMTEAKVKAWQSSNGLTPDGFFGAKSKAVANGAVVVVTPNNPNATCPVGFTCTSTTTTTVSGGAGDLSLNGETSTDVEDTLKEGDEDVKVLGFKAEADGSDISVTNLKVVFENEDVTDTPSSDKLSRYVDSVKVFLGDEEVGSADVSDFSRDSQTGADLYTKTISLKDAVIKDGKEAKLFVAVTVVSNVDSDDMAANWKVEATTLRYTDGTGAIMSDTVSEEANFTFEDASTDDDLDIKTSSANPDDTTVEVFEDDKSDEVLVGAFKLDVDDNSSDITINEFPIELTIAGNAVTLESVEDVVDSLRVEIDGDEYEANLDSDTDFAASIGTATYLVDVGDDGITINSGDTVEVKIYAVFNEQESGSSANYTDGSTVVSVDVNVDDIDAEGEEGDAVSDAIKSGTLAGNDFTLSTGASTVTFVSKSSEKSDDDATGTFSFTFKVTASDSTEITGFDINDIVSVVIGTDTSATSKVLSAVSGDYDETSTGVFTIAEGETATFVYDVTQKPGNAGVYRVRLDSVLGNSIGSDGEIAGPQTLAA